MVVIFSKASPEPVLVNSTFTLSCLVWKASTTLFSMASEKALPQAM